MISADGRTAIIPVVMAGDLTQAENNIDKVHAVVHAADGKGGFDTLVTGAASINSDFSQTAESDLRKGEGIGVPIALVILLIVFGAVVAAGPAHPPQPARHHHGHRPRPRWSARRSTSPCSPSTW